MQQRGNNEKRLPLFSPPSYINHSVVVVCFFFFFPLSSVVKSKPDINSSPESLMVTVETIHHPSSVSVVEADSSPRISFSAEFLEEKLGVVSIETKSLGMEEEEEEDSGEDDGVLDMEKTCSAAEFEFLSTNANLDSMLSADELFREGKLLPKFWLTERCCDEKLENVGLKIESRRVKDEGGEKEKEDRERGSADANPDWFMDEDPSPRPPKCTVLWKELLRLRKQRTTSSSCPPTSMLLSPSSSSSSTSSSSSSMADVATKEGKDGAKGVKRIKKGGGGLERTSSGTVRIRPMINVPICTVAKASRLQQPLFPMKKGRVEW